MSHRLVALKYVSFYKKLGHFKINSFILSIFFSRFTNIIFLLSFNEKWIYSTKILGITKNRNLNGLLVKSNGIGALHNLFRNDALLDGMVMFIYIEIILQREKKIKYIIVAKNH